MKKILLIFLLPLLLPSSVFAQNVQDQNTDQNIKSVLSVSPVIINAQLKKGEKNTYELRVKNLLDQPLGIKTSVEEFTAADEEVAISTNPKTPILNFSTLSKDSFIMNPGESQTLELTINTPSNLKDGGYYEVVFLTPFYIRNLNTTSPTVLSKIGVLVIGSLGNLDYKDLQTKVKILNLSADKNSQGLNVNLRVENDYFTHFIAKPFLTLTPLFGASERIELSEKTILPGKIRKWNEQIIPKNKSVLYKANLAVSVGQGNYIYKDSYFILLPIKNILLSTVLMLIVIFVLLRRKQFKKALKILIKS